MPSNAPSDRRQILDPDLGSGLVAVKFPIDPVEAPNTPEELRRQVEGLFSSYHATDVDFLAEIVQNSIDALEDLYGGPGAPKGIPRIEIDVDSEKNVLTISDNGPGLPDEIMSKLGRPYNSNKDRSRKRGFKGVGLTYAAWSSQRFRFATKRAGENEVTSGVLEGARDWVAGTSAGYPKVHEAKDFKPAFLAANASGVVFEFSMGTEKSVVGLLRRLNDRGVEMLIRTRTAIGYVSLPSMGKDGLPDWARKATVLVRISGRNPLEVRLGYLYPHEYFGKAAFDLAQWGGLSVEKQQQLLHSKRCIYHLIPHQKVKNLFADNPEWADLAELVEGQAVEAYVAFFDYSDTFKEWNEALYVPHPGPGRKRPIAESGVHLATATMPCGDVITADLSYGTGNKSRLYVVVSFRNAPPDQGRKTFQAAINRVAQRVTDYATRELLVPNRGILELPPTQPHGPTEYEQELTLSTAKDQASAKPDLSIQDVGIVKEPGNEQEVVALFHALLAANHLRGYQILAVHGSSKKYDSVFAYKLDRRADVMLDSDPLGLVAKSFGEGKSIQFPASILEFKPLASHIVDDFESGYKSFKDIRLLVAWDVGKQEAFSESSDYRIREVHHETAEKQFHGQTHVITATSGGGRLHVLLLRPIVAILAKAKTQ